MKIATVASVALIAVLMDTACQTAHPPAAGIPGPKATAPAITSQTAATPEPDSKPGAVEAKAAEPDLLSDLIAQVEKDYQAGQQNYAAGHLEAAQADFDRAFDRMMASPPDFRADPRFQDELDRVLDGVKGLELQALQQGDGFTEQKSEPAPIDEANDVTFPVDPNIRAQAEAEVKSTHSDLPLMMTDQVASYINFYSTRGRGVLERALVRGGRYQAMIHATLQEEGVPQDLIYLAVAESGFQPLALSRAGARGMWQFMAQRASGYGLERNWWIDERQDPEKSTRAAARHLKDLYNQFGDWYLAMAAYNSGPGTVQSAVKRTGYADFWELYRRNVLPKETRNYVPIILAVTIMAKNPAQYGLDGVVPEKPVPYDTVRINYPVDLRLVAECVDASAASLQDLNPSLLRMTTPKDQGFDLHLPAGTKDAYTEAIAAIPQDMRVWWRYHKVVPGDSLATLAQTYRISPQAIAQANSLAGTDLPTDAKLIIPIAPGKHVSDEDGLSYSRHATSYKVRKGDTVETVAENFGVPASKVRSWNHLKGNSLKGRRIVYVHLPLPPGARETQVASHSAGAHSSASHSSKTQHSGSMHPTPQPASAKAVVHHTVKSGETLYSIANNYNTTVAALKRDNGNPAILRPGMILVVREKP
jgi:membrane-bound lytic murein transglycosylase D